MRCLVLALTLILAYSPSAMAQRDKFNETHSEMFVFVEKADSLKEYGYRGFCKNTRTFACMNRLSYRDYLGKRGHFLSMEPVARASGYEFREVILETGEKYFFVAKPHKGNILGAANGDISFVSDIEAGQSELGKPIVDGSPVSITRVKRQYGWTLYYTNDGEPLKD